MTNENKPIKKKNRLKKEVSTALIFFASSLFRNQFKETIKKLFSTFQNRYLCNV